MTTVEKIAAGLFSPSLFVPFLKGDSPVALNRQTDKFREVTKAYSCTNSGVIKTAFDLLSKKYRNEYFYKNLIASNLFVGRHRAANSVLINEFKIGGSVADCVLVNGAGVVYEIKTAFDKPDKLHKQVSDYYRAFGLVKVVVPESESSRYEIILKDTPIGLISVGSRGQLSEFKSALVEKSHFDRKVIYDSLRVGEVESLIIKYFGELPNIPNGLRYECYRDILSDIPLETFQLELERVLKARVLVKRGNPLLAEKFKPLRSVVIQLQPSLTAQMRLVDWLESEAI